ncbi:DNA polymerase III subunit chi [Chthonobacter albigriseus]|uniref:DNA polymerase III subunit chi n=1 Tax=Chthonobacter albigriseus TaxID=1683161 RepID=UPI0015EEBEDE|nr:DNA polymerase III subunit chi [Chthonobacter albigriseus]
MTELLFYHLDSQPLDAVLPTLLAKSLERGWRVVVQVGSPERLEAIDSHLWTFADESFLPHGTAADGHEAEQPIFLTTDHANPNAATVRFLVDRAAPPPDVAAYDRVVILFDGGDPEALAEARGHWKTLKAAGHEVTYWQQADRGGWQRKA